MLWWLLGPAIVLLLVGAFWDWVRDAITNWLHKHNLNESALMKAWVQVDRVASRWRKAAKAIRVRIFVKDRSWRRTRRVEDVIYGPDELDKVPDDVRAQMETKQSVKQDILEMVT